MKNIKTIDQFLLEALRDNWRESIKDKDYVNKNMEMKYFGKVYTKILQEEILNDLCEYFKNPHNGGYKDFVRHLKGDFYWDLVDGGGIEYISQDEFYEVEEYNLKFNKHLKLVIQEEVSGLSEVLLKSSKRNIPIDIYRMIDVESDWLDEFLGSGDILNLGEHWSFDIGGVGGYGANGLDHDVVFHAKVLQTDINLWRSFFQNVEYPEECEINLYPNTPLELISIEIDGQKVDLSNFKNKEIYA
jgi:hypothetical protein